jgi:uncharacterized protein
MLPIKVKKSAIHGKGLFATKTIKTGTALGRYEGPVVTEDSIYVLWVGDAGEEIGINGENELKYLNHHSEPNAEFDGVELQTIRSISKGEEITIHYGEEWL